MILTCTLICIIINHNNHNCCIYIDKSLITTIFFVLSLLQFYFVSVFVPVNYLFFKDLNFFILIDIFVIFTHVVYFYFYEQNYDQNLNNRRIHIPNIRISRYNRRIINRTNNNIQNSFNRSNLLIAEKEDFECNICYDINTKYYDIPCFNVDHIVCEKCSKNSLFNIKKCPWCNTQVRVILQL